MAYIKMYLASNNSVISESPSTSNPVEHTLRADQNEVKGVRLYVKSDSGYSHSGVTITPTGGTNAKWALAQDSSGNPGTYGSYGASLSLGSVTTTNRYFWARARATSDEDPVNDTSVTLNVTGIASAI